MRQKKKKKVVSRFDLSDMQRAHFCAPGLRRTRGPRVNCVKSHVVLGPARQRASLSMLHVQPALNAALATVMVLCVC